MELDWLRPLVRCVEVDEWFELCWEGLMACHVTGQGQQVLHRWVLGLVDYLVGLPAVHCLKNSRENQSAQYCSTNHADSSRADSNTCFRKGTDQPGVCRYRNGCISPTHHRVYNNPWSMTTCPTFLLYMEKQRKEREPRAGIGPGVNCLLFN